MAELIKISKAINTQIAVVEFRDLFTAKAVSVKEVRLDLSAVGEIREDGRTLTVVHPAGEYTFKPSQVDDIDGNVWAVEGVAWSFDVFYSHIKTFLGWN